MIEINRQDILMKATVNNVCSESLAPARRQASASLVGEVGGCEVSRRIREPVDLSSRIMGLSLRNLVAVS